MSKETGYEVSPFEAPLNMWEAHTKDPLKDAKPIDGVRQDLLDIPPHRSSEELDGVTFVIVGAKAFESSFEMQDHAYFVGCVGLDGQRFTTVLGGMILVETLDALIAAGNTEPLRVTLREKKQGKFGRYYVFE